MTKDKGTISTLSIWSDDQKIVLAMLASGMSQEDVAERLSIDQSTVSRRIASAFEDVAMIEADGFEIVRELPTLDA